MELKEIISIALNRSYEKPRYAVSKVEVKENKVDVYYFDNLKNIDETCEFTF